jgi:hypothetical protein
LEVGQWTIFDFFSPGFPVAQNADHDKVEARLPRIVLCWEATRARQSSGLANDLAPGGLSLACPAFLFSPAPPFGKRLIAGPAQSEKSTNPPGEAANHFPKRCNCVHFTSAAVLPALTPQV